jgi:hypothetical protein
MKNLIKQLTKSHRIYHLGFMLIISFILSFISIIGNIMVIIAIATTLEFKDVLWSSKIDFTLKNILKLKWTVFDLKDWIATIIGGILGLIIFFII